MKKTKFLALLLALVLVIATVALAACKDKQSGENGITLTPTELTLMVGGSGKTIRATVVGTEEAITWSVDNTDVVKLTPVKSVVTVAPLKEGTATVTAKAGEYTATCSVTVTPDTTEKVSITLNGEAVTKASVDMDASITLEATASQGSPITWTSSNEIIATVDGGVVTGHKPGDATITAKVSEKIKAEVVVTVNSVGGYEYYEISVKGVLDEMERLPGIWEGWTEWAQFPNGQPTYDNGTVSIDFIENGGNWYNLQLFCINSDIVASKYYKLTFDMDSTASGHVTVNGNVLTVEEGKHTYTAYFTNGNGFNMQFGVEGANPVIDMRVGKVEISNVKYEEDTSRVTLETPSFIYNAGTGVITISDPNEVGVKNYVLNLYQEGKIVAGLTLTGSGEIDWSLVESGIYQATIKAVGVNVHYIDSAESEQQEIEVVNEGGISYKFYNIPEGDSTPKDAGGATAIQQPGIWTYWSSSWVTIEGEYKDGKLTVTFSNNQGTWSDTQLNYRYPGLDNGKLYKLQLAIFSSAPDGKVTLNGSEFTIKEGQNTYDIVFIEKGGLSIQITFGLDGQDTQQDIKAASMVFEILGVEEVQASKLNTPSYSYDADSGIITIVDPNTVGVGGYELGFFKGDQLVKSVAIKSGDVVDVGVVGAGKYTLKVRAIGISLMYTESDWSEGSATVESENENTPVDNGDENAALGAPDTWKEWHDQNWVGATVTMTECIIDANGSLKLTYSVRGSNWFAVQLFKSYSTCVAGKTYTVTLKIQSSVAGKITVCGQVVDLQVGSNDVEVTFTQQAGKATIRIQFGVESPSSMIAGGTFTLSDVVVVEASQTQLEAPSFELDGDKKITITDANEAGVGSYELGFFQGDTLIKSIAIKNGDTVDASIVVAGTYTLKIRAIAANANYVDSDWSTVTATIVSEADKTDIDYSEEGTFSEGWRYWDSKTSADWNQWTEAHCTECYINGDGKLTVVFNITGSGAMWAMQLFYKVADGASAYNSSMTITASVDTTIIVCGQTVELTANEAKTVTIEGYKSDNGSAIVIQFGLTGGSFTIENVTVTAA